jgi:hypothetical protein
MSAEWQARQLLLIASEPGPSGNILSLSGKSNCVVLSSIGLAPSAMEGVAATLKTMTNGSKLRNI